MHSPTYDGHHGNSTQAKNKRKHLQKLEEVVLKFIAGGGDQFRHNSLDHVDGEGACQVPDAVCNQATCAGAPTNPASTTATFESKLLSYLCDEAKTWQAERRGPVRSASVEMRAAQAARDKPHTADFIKGCAYKVWKFDRESG